MYMVSDLLKQILLSKCISTCAGIKVIKGKCLRAHNLNIKNAQHREGVHIVAK